MKTQSNKYSQLFVSLTQTIKAFLKEIKKHDLSDMATDKWTVKDELSHIVFWHDYYAQNYAAMAKGTKPFLFVSKGGSTRNQEGVDKLHHKSTKYLVATLNRAQSSLFNSIVVKKVPKMTYIVGRDYKTEVFLKLIDKHIERHTILVRRAKKVKK